jgi:hypothetical protein
MTAHKRNKQSFGQLKKQKQEILVLVAIKMLKQ